MRIVLDYRPRKFLNFGYQSTYAIFLFLKDSDNDDKDVAALVLNDNNNLFSQKRKAVCCIIFLKVRLQFTFESLINNFSLFWGVGTQMLAIGSLFLDHISFLLMFLLYFSWLCYFYWFCQYRYSNWL